MAKTKIFDSVQVKSPKYNKFDLSYMNTLSCNMGKLVPFFVQDVLPGDKIKVKKEHLLKMMPLATPMLQRVNVYFHYFFVPYRLIWNDFEKFITGGADGLAAPAYPVLGTNNAVWSAGSLPDYLGFPTNGNPTDAPIDAMPFRAYNLIYNNYYRDQNFEKPIPVPLGSGLDNSYTDEDGNVLEASIEDMTTLRNRPYPKDYFTSALPFVQRGPAAKIPITANVTLPAGSIYSGNDPGEDAISIGSPAIQTFGSSATVHNLLVDGLGSGYVQAAGKPQPGATIGRIFGNSTLPVPGKDIELESSSADGTIIELRRAFALQEFLEKSARGGARYIENLLSFFGVRGSDYRLQRPLYLGGARNPIVISELLQTSETTQGEDGHPLGTMSGQGNSLGGGFMFNRYFEEHGLVLGILSIMPKASYFKGIPRRYLRRDKFDFYWPQFAHIGEQPILTSELYYDGTNENDTISNFNEENVFGYTPRYAEYRFNNDEIHGQFRTTLKNWHMARDFESVPNLNSQFLAVDDSQYRPFSDVNPIDDHFYIQIYNNVKALRKIPKYGSPKI